MGNKRLLAVILIGIMLFSILNGCKNSFVAKKSKKEIKGKIIVMAQHTDTDIVESVLKKKYVPEFNKKYPKVKVEVEAFNDYQTAMQERLNNKDYGDVVLIPNISKDQLPIFFQSLGNETDMSKKYKYLKNKSYNGKCYGIPVIANTYGILINKIAWEDAKITVYPKSMEEFISTLKKIKMNGKVKIPLYIDFSCKELLAQWNRNCAAMIGDKNWKNEMTDENSPFSRGKPFYEVFNLLYQVVKQRLTESNSTAIDWEKAKKLLVDGKVGSMVVGSWALPQIKPLTEETDLIGYIPFPAAPDGKQYALVTGEYYVGINKNSKNKQAAKAWLFWFVNESKFSEDNCAIPTVKGKKLPEVFKTFKDGDVQFIEEAQAPSGKENLWKDIEEKSGIGISTGQAEARIIKAGLTGKESFCTIMSNFNKRWKAARAAVK